MFGISKNTNTFDANVVPVENTAPNITVGSSHNIPSNGGAFIEFFDAPNFAHTFTDRGVMAVNSTFDGGIGFFGDQDWIRFDFEVGSTYQIQSWSFSMSPYIQLRDNFGNFLTDAAYELVNVNGINYGVATMEVTATRSGSYYVNVQDFEADQSFGAYTLAISEVDSGPSEIEDFTLDEIAFRLTDTGWAFFDGERRSFDEDTITYDLSAIGAGASTLAKHAFDSWAKLTGLVFRDVSGAGSAMITFDDTEPGVAFANSQLKASGSMLSANINIATDWETSFGTTLDSHLFQTYIHEIGHTLGLAHAGDYNAGNGQPVSYPSSVLYKNDTLNLTIMSYISQDMNTEDGADFAIVTTPQIADIIAIQDLYGVASSAYAGNTRYGVNSNTGDYMDFVFASLTQGDTSSSLISGGQPLAFTLWDTGGRDMINFKTDTTKQKIDLRAEKLSDIYGTKGSMVMGRDTIIEKVIAGTKNDIVIGNGARNVLDGRKGGDILKGGSGADKLVGGAGKDKLFGEKGNDVLKGGGGADKFIFEKKGGKDVIKDFADNKDTLQLDDALWSGVLTVSEVLEEFGSFSKGDSVLKFNKSTKITIEDMTLNQLGNDIDII